MAEPEKSQQPQGDLDTKRPSSSESTNENKKVDHEKPSKDSKDDKAIKAESPSSSSAAASKSKSPFRGVVDTLESNLPPWVFKNLKTPRSLKTFLRCWLASWVGFILILPHKSLNTLGAAGFFAMLSSFFLPPNMPVQLFIFLISTLLVGLLLGWGFGSAAMRAMIAVRNQDFLRAATLQLQQTIQSNPALRANPSFAQTDALFHGWFLDTRSSAMAGFFLALGTFIFGSVRAYAPKLTMLAMFGTIGVDVFCSYGPLFPAPQYNLLTSFIVAASCYGAIGLALTIFVFPETMSHSFLRQFVEQLGRAKALVEIQDQVLESKPEELIDAVEGKDGELLSKIKGMRGGLIGVQQQLRTFSAFVSFEFSWGKWNSDDVKDLVEPLSALISRISGLQGFGRLVGQTHSVAQHDTNHDKSTNDPSSTSQNTSTSKTTTKKLASDTYLMQQISKINSALESDYSLRITDLLPIVDESTKDLRAACISGIDCTIRNLENINKHRWTKNPDVDGSLSRSLDESLEALRKAQSEFEETGRLKVLKPFSPFLERAVRMNLSEEEQNSLPLRNLFVSYVFCTNVIGVAEALTGLMELTRKTMGKRKVNRLWAPKGLRALWKLFTVKGDENDRTLGEDAHPKAEAEDEEDKLCRRDPDSRPPTNLFQKIMNSVHGVYRWTKTIEARFIFKYMFVSVALWVPSVVRRTAHFTYVNRGFWALVTAQTTLNLYAADQIYNLITRLIGTFIGAALGLLTWYMGNGSGTGNPYGIAAATGLVLVPVTFIRLYSPPQHLPGIVLICATFALVVGYSWVDGHLILYTSPGVGWNVAWRRFLLIVIGSVASFIMMMLPPTSGRTAVRLRNASLITQLGHLYSFLIATWISTESLNSDGDSSSDEDVSVTHPNSKWKVEFRRRLLNTADLLVSTRAMTNIATWEGSIRGKWPVKEYHAMLDVESEMITFLAQLGGALSHMDDEWRLQFLHNTRALNPHFITDVMAVFSLISQSLRTAEPLHTVLPQSLLGRLMYHSHSHHHLHVHLEGDSKRSSIALDQVTSIDYMYYATGIVAMFQLLRSLDELHRITKELCGEIPLKGFTDWRDQFERSHTRV